MILAIEESASRQIGKEVEVGERKNGLLNENKLRNAKTFSKDFLKKVGESYKCNFCNQSFKEDAYLKQYEDHVKEFHKVPEKEFHQLFQPLFSKMKKDNVSNSIVGLSYIKTSKLTPHEKNAQSNKFKPFICTQCSKSYTTSSSLNRHRKNVHNIALPPKRLKKKTTKSVITREQLSKELKKVMKSKVGNEGKKNNQSMTLPKVTLVNTPSRKRKVSEVNHPNDEELFQASAPEKKRHRFHTRANKESDGIIFKTWPKRK